MWPTQALHKSELEGSRRQAVVFKVKRYSTPYRLISWTFISCCHRRVVCFSSPWASYWSDDDKSCSIAPSCLHVVHLDCTPLFRSRISSTKTRKTWSSRLRDSHRHHSSPANWPQETYYSLPIDWFPAAASYVHPHWCGLSFITAGNGWSWPNLLSAPYPQVTT